MIGNYKIIAVCISRVHDTSSYEFVTKLNEKLKGDNYRLFVYNLCNEFYWDENRRGIEASLFNLIDYSVTDAVVIMNEKIRDVNVTESIIAKAKENNVPAIVVDGEYEGAYNLEFDYKKGFEDIVRHVIEKHAIKDVHFMGGSVGNPFADERLEVFKKVAAENGIDFNDSMVSNGNFAAEETIDATKKIIASGKIPKAIICANDIMAINVVDTLMDNDIKVPEDCIVTGFDGIDEIKHVTPSISSCFCNYSDMANQAACVIKKATNGESIDNIELVSPELIIAESCGCVEVGAVDDRESLKKIGMGFFRIQDESRELFAIIEAMQDSLNLESAVACLDKGVFNDMCIVINKICTDRSVLLRTIEIENYFEDDMCLIYDTMAKEGFKPTEFKKSDIVPSLNDRLSSGYPLIFSELDFMGISLGYVCFLFDNYNISNYAEISLEVTALRNAIGGFINAQYQHYISEQMGELYKIDPQTNLYNLQGFEMEYSSMYDRLKNNDGDLTAIFVDLDNLKSINDEFGYGAGDEAIQAVAESFKEACPDSALCVHFGGSDMLAAIEGDVDPKAIKADMIKLLAEYNEQSENPYEVQFSVGAYKAKGSSNIEVETIIKETRKLSNRI
ncbi:MAG: GGDEF domain-containing protein [Lachnospiraceae bacterium]|nr:GGDEF domain-containing protein [Lachnospiraceae bacterium]